MDLPFQWALRVYYEDTDAGGIVFYANYLKFFERARTEWLRAAGVEQQQLASDGGVIFIVRSTSVDYLSPARLDDTLRIDVSIERLGRASVDFAQQAWIAEPGGTTRLVCTGTIRVGCVSAASLRPTAIPAWVLERIQPARPEQISKQN